MQMMQRGRHGLDYGNVILFIMKNTNCIHRLNRFRCTANSSTLNTDCARDQKLFDLNLIDLSLIDLSLIDLLG